MDRLALYEKLVATNPKVERKGDKVPYTSLNGNMFSFLTMEGPLALRLSAEGRDAFVKKHKTEPVVQHGAVMKEYVLVPDKLLANTKAMKPYFDESLAYATSLKPKATTKKKAATKKKAPAKKKSPAKKKRATAKR